MGNQIKIRKNTLGKVIVSHDTMIGVYTMSKRQDGSPGLACEGDLIRADGLNDAIAATMADGVERAITSQSNGMSQADHKAFDASRDAINNAMTLNGKTY